MGPVSEVDCRLLGARDGLVSAMLVVRREIGSLRARLGTMPRHWVRRRAKIEETLALLARVDADLDTRRKKCGVAWRERQSVEIVSGYRPHVER